MIDIPLTSAENHQSRVGGQGSAEEQPERRMRCWDSDGRFAAIGKATINPQSVLATMRKTSWVWGQSPHEPLPTRVTYVKIYGAKYVVSLMGASGIGPRRSWVLRMPLGEEALNQDVLA